MAPERPDPHRRRALLALLGLGLGACRTHEGPGPAAAEDRATLSADLCPCMPGGGPPGASPFTPPAAPAPPPPPATVPGGSRRNFSQLGPDSAELGVLMGGPGAFLTLDDGSRIRVWGFVGPDGTGFNGDRPVPGPLIELTEEREAAITLASMMPHSLHPHGLDVDQANDGVPSTSGFVGMAMPMGGFGRVQGLPSLGTRHTYRFTAPHAGTYFYHCHVDTVLHMEMGMAGTIIVRPPDGARDRAWAGGPRFAREAVWQLHTFDSRWHDQRVSGAGTRRYRPDRFLLNGRSGADAQTDPSCVLATATGEPLLLRLVNLGYQPARIDPGLPVQVIASDGRPLPRPVAAATLTVHPGERYDLLIDAAAPHAGPARIDYLDIRGRRVLGSVTTQLTIA